MLKLVGGASVAVVLVATPGFKDGRSLIVDAMLIALAANLGNLLDRAPGRTIKFGLVAYVPHRARDRHRADRHRHRAGDRVPRSGCSATTCTSVSCSATPAPT